MLRVTFELGKEAGNACLRRDRRAPQALQVAVIDQSGEVLTNRNVPSQVPPILKVIGGLPPSGSGCSRTLSA
jgi:hypothetical protein